MQEKYIKATLSKILNLTLLTWFKQVSITSLNLKTQFKGQRYWVFGVYWWISFHGKKFTTSKILKKPIIHSQQLVFEQMVSIENLESKGKPWLDKELKGAYCVKDQTLQEMCVESKHSHPVPGRQRCCISRYLNCQIIVQSCCF